MPRPWMADVGLEGILDTRLATAAPPPHDLLRLEHQLCFALYASVRAIIRTYREHLEPLGLTYPQYLVLLVLYEQNGLTITQIGERLALDSGTLTPLVKRMAANELLRRKRSDGDQREVHIWLEPKAHTLRPGILEARRQVARKLGMTEPQIAALRAELMDLIARLDDADHLLANANENS